MRPVAEHQAVVAELIRRREPVELSLQEAAGLALATAVTAPRALPSFDNSAMDGYAVRAEDIAGALPDTPVLLPVAADIPAGRVDGPPLLPGTAHRIMTGAPMPPGSDAVVQVEATDGGMATDDTATVAIYSARAAGTHVRRSGEDVQVGETVLTQGQRLGPSQLGLLAALGVASVSVFPPLRVLVLSTGTELVAPGTPLQHGQIHESNGIMLASAVRGAAAQAQQWHFVPDDVDAFLRAVDSRAAEVDLIITSGGVSAGAYEVVKDALTGRGVEFVKVAMQPGMPQGCGTYADTPIITLPGNPVSALVSFEVFIRPALRAAMGFAQTERHMYEATLVESVRSPAGKRQFRRGVLDRHAGTVQTIGPPASHFLRWMASANCLLDIGEDVQDLEAGSEVHVWDLED